MGREGFGDGLGDDDDAREEGILMWAGWVYRGVG